MHYKDINTKELKASKIARLEFFTKIDTSKKEAVAIEIFRKDPIAFINLCLFTYDPRKKPSHIPFFLYEFQKETVIELIEQIENGEDYLVEKSRDMGITWLVLAVGLWGWLFKGWDGKIGSRKEAYIDKEGAMDSLFEKIRYMVRMLPKFVLPTGYTSNNSSYMKLYNPDTGNAITGEAPTADFGTGARAKWVLMDEFAYWQYASSAWLKTGDTTPCRIAVSTPNGRGNKYAELRFSGQIKVKTLHWKLHPEKDEEWYNQESKRRTAEEIAQELDISYDNSVRGRVYPEADNIIIGEGDLFEYNPYQRLYAGIDFGHGGEDPTAIVWYQVNENDYITIIDAVEHVTGDMSFFAPFFHGEYMLPVNEYKDEHIPLIERHKEWNTSTNYGDPYDLTATMLKTNIKKEFMNAGIAISHAPRLGTQEQIRQTKLKMKKMRINKRCDQFIYAIKQARYPQRVDTSQSTTANVKPIHDWTSHFRTALEYGMISYKQSEGTDPNPEKRNNIIL